MHAKWKDISLNDNRPPERVCSLDRPLNASATLRIVGKACGKILFLFVFKRKREKEKEKKKKPSTKQPNPAPWGDQPNHS